MIDPRTSNDPDLQAALRAWDATSPPWAQSFDESMRIRAALRDTSSHQAFGWAALTAGRIAAYRGDADLAEVLLTEAHGRFFLARDEYGTQMVTSHLAIPQVGRRNLDRALEFALPPLAAAVPYSTGDRSLLHNNAAMCYWARAEWHDAISQLVREFDLIRDGGKPDRQSTVLGNIGAVLKGLGQWELALSVTSKAWQLQLESCSDPSTLQLSQLANIVHFHCYLGNFRSALVHAEQLEHYISVPRQPIRWMYYLILVDAYSLNQLPERATGSLSRARALAPKIPTDFSAGHLTVGHAMLMGAEGDFRGCMSLALELVNQPISIVGYEVHMSAAFALIWAAKSLRLTAEAVKWARRLEELRHERSLGDILSTQVRASLSVTGPNAPMTERELACLSLAARGQTSADIAMKLGITTRTANFHFSKILRKLNAANRQEAIAKAISANLL